MLFLLSELIRVWLVTEKPKRVQRHVPSVVRLPLANTPVYDKSSLIYATIRFLQVRDGAIAHTKGALRTRLVARESTLHGPAASLKFVEPRIPLVSRCRVQKPALGIKRDSYIRYVHMRTKQATLDRGGGTATVSRGNARGWRRGLSMPGPRKVS